MINAVVGHLELIATANIVTYELYKTKLYKTKVIV